MAPRAATTSRPDVLKENVKTFFDESKGKVDQGLSRIFTTFSIYITLCTFCFVFFYSSKLFNQKNCCLPPVSWSSDPQDCCTLAFTNVRPSCCSSPIPGDQITHCHRSESIKGLESLVCRQHDQPVFVGLGPELVNESAVSNPVAVEAAVSLLGNCTTNGNSRTYQQLSIAITSGLVSVGLTLLTFATIQGHMVAIAQKELQIYRDYLRGVDVQTLKDRFWDTAVARGRQNAKFQWKWRFFLQLFGATLDGPMSLIFLFVILLTLAVLGVAWSSEGATFCQMRLPSIMAILRTALFQIILYYGFALLQTAFMVQKEFVKFKELQEGLLELATKGEEENANPIDKEAVIKDIAWSLRVSAWRDIEQGDDDVLGKRPTDLQLQGRALSDQSLGSSGHRWEADDFEAAGLGADSEARCGFNYLERPIADEDSDQESADIPLIRRPRSKPPHGPLHRLVPSELEDIQEASVAPPRLPPRPPRSMPGSTPKRKQQLQRTGSLDLMQTSAKGKDKGKTQ